MTRYHTVDNGVLLGGSDFDSVIQYTRIGGTVGKRCEMTSYVVESHAVFRSSRSSDSNMKWTASRHRSISVLN